MPKPFLRRRQKYIENYIKKAKLANYQFRMTAKISNILSILE